jgi:hypothetical protein
MPSSIAVLIAPLSSSALGSAGRPDLEGRAHHTLDDLGAIGQDRKGR